MASQRKTKNSPRPLALDFDDLPEAPRVASDAVRPKDDLLSDANPNNDQTSFAISLMALAGIEGLGNRGVRALDQQFGMINVWNTEKSDLLACLNKARLPSAEPVVTQITSRAKHLLALGQESVEELRSKKQVHIIPGSDLPDQLRSISAAPRWLFVQGNPHVLYSRALAAIVGTRKPTEEGLRATTIVSDVLSVYPAVIVSGLAEGIDEEAHFATLQRRRPNIAFLGHGINYEFPASTSYLRHRIVEEGGAVATEYLPQEKYQRSFFVERNRLQAALSNLVIPVQATSIGGTAHTVRFAQRYQRSIIGISWPGANGILGDLIKAGAPIFDVFTSDGRRGLDALIKQTVRNLGEDTYPLALLEKRVALELRQRNATPEDVERLLNAVNNSAKDIHPNATP